MVMKISVISITFVLLWMVCITTQKKWKQSRCDKAAKKIKKNNCEYECKSTNSFKVPGKFRNFYF